MRSSECNQQCAPHLQASGRCVAGCRLQQLSWPTPPPPSLTPPSSQQTCRNVGHNEAPMFIRVLKKESRDRQRRATDESNTTLLQLWCADIHYYTMCSVNCRWQCSQRIKFKEGQEKEHAPYALVHVFFRSGRRRATFILRKDPTDVITPVRAVAVTLTGDSKSGVWKKEMWRISSDFFVCGLHNKQTKDRVKWVHWAGYIKSGDTTRITSIFLLY